MLHSCLSEPHLERTSVKPVQILDRIIIVGGIWVGRGRVREHLAASRDEALSCVC